MKVNSNAFLVHLAVLSVTQKTSVLNVQQICFYIILLVKYNAILATMQTMEHVNLVILVVFFVNLRICVHIASMVSSSIKEFV